MTTAASPGRPIHSRFAGRLAPATLLLATVASADVAGVTVTHFSPQGIAKGPQQVTARFSGAMVPFGDLSDRVPPFTVDCPARGTSRWIDATTWSFDFEKPLGSGIGCTFTISPDIRSMDGGAVTGTTSFSFTTGGPSVTDTRPYSGDEQIDEQQIFLLSLDGEADLASVREHASFGIERLPERVEADVVKGAELEALLAGMSKWSRPEPPMVALRARRTFPNGKKVRLEWGAGIRAPSGEATTTPQAFEFKVRDAFSASASCRKENARSGCVPILPVTVGFSAPVPVAVAQMLRLEGPGGESKAPRPPGDEERRDGFTQAARFEPPFAESRTYTARFPADFRDDAGRRLPAGQAKGLAVRIGPLPVLAKFASGFGIIERNAAPALPITVRNVESKLAAAELVPVAPADVYSKVKGTDVRVSAESPKQILDWLRRVSLASRRRSIFREAPAAAGTVRRFHVPKPAPAKEAEVIGLAMDEPGLHIVQIESPALGRTLLGQEKPMYVATAALVTNLSVHFKHGREGSIAWVTTLDTAEPVAGAAVVASDCNGAVLASAETGSDGVARFSSLPAPGALPGCWQAWSRKEEHANDDWRDYSDVPALSSMASGILLVARTKDDMSFVHSSWERGIESWRFQLRSSGYGSAELAAHTIFDRPLYRAGETVHMKALLRRRSMVGFSIPAAAERPSKLVVEFMAMDQRYEMPLAFDDTGVATAEWPIPPHAKLGDYSVTFEGPAAPAAGPGQPAAEPRRLWAGSFRVEQFRVPLLRGDVLAPAVVPPRSTSLPVDVTVRYLSGGAAGGLPVVLRSELRPGWFDAPEDFDGYTFAAGAIAEGVRADDGGYESDEAARSHRRYDVELDHAGGVRVTVEELPVVEKPTSLVLEAEFRDPNGEVETVATSRTLLPSSRVPGIRIDDWTKAEDRIRSHVVVLSPDGKPAAGAPVKVDVLRREWFSHRKRLVGGFYGYEHTTETRRIGVLCEGTTDPSGRFDCDAPTPSRGQLLLVATVTDEAGHAAATNTTVWVPGEDDGFDFSDDDRIDVVPEKRAYEPGETARFQVRMPFREATALVTVEREGVGEARIVRLRAEDPVIEIPIGHEHAPNVFVSVLAVRGRVSEVQPTAMADLGRPAFKLGIAEIRVDWKTHRLAVAVTSDRETYRTRETAKVRIAVTRHDGSAVPAGSEVAVAAVDEGLLELLPNESWKLLDAMMSERSYEVQTSTAQGQVVGKRHYGRKALPVGGGAPAGASGPTRELFDTLLFWSPRVKLDGAGQAEVDVPLNDSLTAFRIVAIATGGAGEFGDGATTIRSTRELQTYSGLPPSVREGDRFVAELTLRNTGQRPLAIRTGATFAPATGGPATTLAEQQLELAPGEGRTVTWPVDVPRGTDALSWTFESTSAEGASDRLAVPQRVFPPLPVQVVQATMLQLEQSAAIPVAAPEGADRSVAGSGIEVSGAATLGDSVAPMQAWLAKYPYTCLEQRVSIAIGREDDAAWQKLVGEMESYLDPSGLLAYFPGEPAGDDRLTAYVLAISHASGRTLPETLRGRLTSALARFVHGHIAARSSEPALPDRTLRKLSAIEALARHGKAEASMLGSITVQPELWPTSSVLDWWSMLARMPDVPDAAARKSAVEQVVRARVDLSGTTLVFTTEREDRIWWMMAGPDSNAARLLDHLVEFGLWKEDAPRVLRGAMERRRGGAWETTVANAWGVVAMRRFGRTFEREAVTGRTGATLAGQAASLEWSTPSPAPVTLAWPEAAGALELGHTGTGKPWITTTSKAAVKREEAVAAGYRVTRTATAIEPRQFGRWSRGDRAHVRIDIEAQRPMWWVVVDDPVPAGASHLGTGLGRSAATPALPAGDEDVPLATPAFVERTQQSWRAYLRYVPRGHTRVEYEIRLNQAGLFQLPPLRVEALYAPEVFGEVPGTPIQVEP